MQAAAVGELCALFALRLEDLRRRVRVVKGGRTHTWQFVNTARTYSPKGDSEVDVSEYPYELKRVARLGSASRVPVVDGDSLIDMNDYWYDSEYPLPPVMDTAEALRVFEIVDGTTLFAANDFVDSRREYSWDELMRLRIPADMRALWSNVCDTETSRFMKLLLADLIAAPEPKRETWLKVRLLGSNGLGTGYQLKYVRESETGCSSAARSSLQRPRSMTCRSRTTWASACS